MEFHERFTCLAREIPDPSRGVMREMRRAVVSKFHQPRAVVRQISSAGWLLRVAAGVVIFFLGSLASYFLLSNQPDSLPQILYRQSAPRSLDEALKNSFIYSNVSLRPSGPKLYDVSFDVTTRLSLTMEQASPLFTEILAQSVLNSQNPGMRLRTLGFTDLSRAPLIRDTLIAVLQNDSNPAVRLKALSQLKDFPYGPVIETAILSALRRDPSVPVRLVALDFLAQQPADPALVIQAIRESGQESDPAIQMKAAGYERFDRFLQDHARF
jgi:hypothetical protein